MVPCPLTSTAITRALAWRTLGKRRKTLVARPFWALTLIIYALTPVATASSSLRAALAYRDRIGVNHWNYMKLARVEDDNGLPLI